MKNKDFLNIIVSLRVLYNRYQSNVTEEKLLVVKGFLTLLKKEGILELSKHNAPYLDSKEALDICIRSCENEDLKNLYFDYIRSICSAIRIKYFNELFKIYLNISDKFIKDNAQEFFDYQIRSEFSTNPKISTYSMQPEELTTILNSFCDTKNINSYYNPFAGLASLALKLPEHINYFGEENNENTWILGKLRMLAYNCPSNFDYQLVNSIEKWTFHTGVKFDFISFNPPFNIKLSKSYLPILNEVRFGYLGNANSLIIHETFKLLKPDGIMSFVCPSGFLFGSGSQDKALKEYLTKNGYIKKIIALPERILSFTALSVNIVVLANTQRINPQLEFIDATELVDKQYSKLHTIKLNETLELISSKESEFKRLVTIEEIISNDYNLSVNRYVYDDLGISVEDEENLVQFKNLVQPIARRKVTISSGKLVRTKDLSEDSITLTKNFEDVSVSELKAFTNKLERNTLLLATTWKSLKPTLFEGDSDNIYYDYNSIFACTIDENKVDKEYFVLELSKDYVQKQLDQRRIGSVQSRITRKDLLHIKIIVPSLEVQKKRKYIYQESVINEHQTKVKELMLDYGIDLADENSFLRHKIAGTLKNLRGSFSKLKQIIEEQVVSELPDLYSYKANPKLDSNFLDYLKRIERDLNSIHKSVKAVGVELNLLDIKLEPINFIKFVSDYAEEIKNRNSNRFEIKIDIDEELLKEHRIKEVIVQGDKDFLHQAFNNIIENAERHAFSEDNQINNRIELDLLYDFEDLKVQLDFTNTGKPMPEKAYEVFMRKGRSTGENAGDGVGGWFLNEVMQKHNGYIDITDETGGDGMKGDFATTIELTFPIEIKV
ncbi:MAG: N-6 DNA methylase [Maribacter arcticus]|uniref:N-6 DNA methylase n=1 Tax=Maribacter arcticus TaxID=561365 RepID=UPI00300285B9